MKYFAVVLLCSNLCFACSAWVKQSTALVGTKWKCEIAEGCVNFYEFTTDSTFTFFSCEMEDQYFGNYYFEDGVLMLEQKGSVYDRYLPESSAHRAESKLYKVDVTGDKLKHISMSDWINGKWVESDFKFDENYTYQKTK